jgi:hypothetical protein
MAPDRSSPYRLLVEGRDDKCSIINLLVRHGYDWDSVPAPFVYDAEGIDSLLESLPPALKSHVRVEIVVDADLSLTDRWKSIRAILEANGIAGPRQPDPNGTVIPVTGLARLERVGIWLMPDNKVPGTLEDFLTRLVPAGDPCLPHAETSTQAALTLGAPLRPQNHSKGVIHAWLAWQEKPGQPFGKAINARTFDHETDEACAFVAWFRRLFQS